MLSFPRRRQEYAYSFYIKINVYVLILSILFALSLSIFFLLDTNAMHRPSERHCHFKTCCSVHERPDFFSAVCLFHSLCISSNPCVVALRLWWFLVCVCVFIFALRSTFISVHAGHICRFLNLKVFERYFIFVCLLSISSIGLMFNVFLYICPIWLYHLLLCQCIWGSVKNQC